MVYADGSNPSVRKDIGVRLPFPALTPFVGENSTNGDLSPSQPRREADNSTSGEFCQRTGLRNWRFQVTGGLSGKRV